MRKAIEGYPRTAFQAEELDFLLTKLNQKLDWAIYLKVSESIMTERSLQRGLSDDLPDVIQCRIHNFQTYTVPILEYYDYRQKLLTIDGEQSPDLVEQAIMQQFKTLV
jgi:adenylate kinase